MLGVFCRAPHSERASTADASVSLCSLTIIIWLLHVPNNADAVVLHSASSKVKVWKELLRFNDDSFVICDAEKCWKDGYFCVHDSLEPLACK